MKLQKKLTLALLIMFLFLAFHISMVGGNPGDYTVTLNLHKSPSVGLVNTKSTAGQIFNTTSSWSASTQENSSDVASGNYFSVYFYLNPQLAGTLTLNGAVSAKFFLKANATANDLTLISTLNKISAAGASTQISTKSDASISLSTSYAEKTSSHTSVSTTVASGFTVELNVTIGGSASNLTLYLGYDTAAANSRITLVATDPLAVSLSKNFESYNGGTDAILTVTVTDVFGGYDVAAAPTISFTFPSGLSYSTTASSIGDSQYSNTYTYTLISSSVTTSGTWTSTASISDKSGNSYASSSFAFAVYMDDGFNWSPGGTDMPTPANPVVIIIIGVVIVGLAVLAYSHKGKPRRRKRK